MRMRLTLTALAALLTILFATAAFADEAQRRLEDVASGASSAAQPAEDAPVAAEAKPEPANKVDEKKAASPAPKKAAAVKHLQPKASLPSFTIDRQSAPQLRMAALSGDGNPDSARALMRRLIRKGFLIERIGVAEVRLEVTTVFYGERGEEVARRIAEEIGGGAEAKPMSWQSKFDIVVITGGK